MQDAFYHRWQNRGLPLYEGVDWNRVQVRDNPDRERSPSLRGSGLKSKSTLSNTLVVKVSLFTREWIEIWGTAPDSSIINKSPSLRGSGLKWNGCNESFWWKSLPLYEGVDWNSSLLHAHGLPFRLPLYEGVDWNRHFPWYVSQSLRLPLYEGVDWNQFDFCMYFLLRRSPSLRGSGLKFWLNDIWSVKDFVSLFTREWIEMKTASANSWGGLVSLFTREWIEIIEKSELYIDNRSPSLRGSGLKLIH